jgi:multiple sugar transport system permease protein
VVIGVTGRRLKSTVGNWTWNTVTAVVVLFSLFPLYWLISTSMKDKVDAFAMPPVWFFAPNLESYETVVSAGFLDSYLNSFIVSVITTALAIVFGVASGYSLARNNSRAGNAMGLWIILSRMIPPMGVIIPFYMISRHMGWLDNYITTSLIYLTTTLPFVTWLIMGFVKGVPRELEEAAMIDGCTRTASLVRVVIPVIKPGIATCAIFTFMLSWNEYFYALIMTGKNTKPVSIAIQGFISSSGTDWGMLCAAGVLVVLPILVFTVFCQKSLVRGLTGGAVKG